MSLGPECVDLLLSEGFYSTDHTVNRWLNRPGTPRKSNMQSNMFCFLSVCNDTLDSSGIQTALFSSTSSNNVWFDLMHLKVDRSSCVWLLKWFYCRSRKCFKTNTVNTMWARTVKACSLLSGQNNTTTKKLRLSLNTFTRRPFSSDVTLGRWDYITLLFSC